MIQWFPGHMAKAINQIKEKAPLVDLFIVVLDARAPLSTYNEEFDKISPNKPRLFVITKTDLADLDKLPSILKTFNHAKDGVVTVSLKKKTAQKKILKEAERLLAPKRAKDIKKGLLKPRLRAVVVGVPNSGKSTLINLLANKSKTKVGNMPGVTKGQQWVNTGTIHLLDTPGILWPKFEDDLIGVKLSVIGSIKISIIPQRELFNEAYKLLTKYYPKKIISLGLEPTTNENEIYSNLLQLCRNKKYLKQKGELDIDKGFNFFVNYLRDLKGVTYD
ncbi:ribosome biogenesis GTPase YlqF [Candidatus Mycoplasma mahonii]|uniref:ribosome biogenesis GTPase YlqF n=1 Tax=Candidatus Mycoplasma mahonii TaxID=3004105 RepID=UPI0026EB6904|nr:ribosome biogenesis GTPase YlqF [Candidatus Mycoplasma mahonii]WKX02306.1 ribosome biogenesis GTPase YlqF [Candidatus Mycoplasma mahonii]